MDLSTRTVGIVVAVAAGLALATALASERWGGLVPCALCLLERWPYRAAVLLGLLAAFLPRRAGRFALAGALVATLAGAGLGLVHVGVEQGFWPSPLPECAAPRLGGGSIASRLASLPARPAKPCDDPTYLVPGVKLSMAAMNLLYSLALSGLVGVALARGGSALTRGSGGALARGGARR